MTKKLQAICFVLIVPFLLAGCAMGPSPFPKSIVEDTALVPPDGRIELAVDENGQVGEVEFHIAHGHVPSRVMETIDGKFPGGEIVDCEKEYDGNKLYYEVTKTIKGRNCEVMCTEGGMIHRIEQVIAEADAPPAVITTANRKVPGGELTQVEKILDGNEKLLEYHIKKSVKGMHYKILINPDGSLVKAYREVMAEIEVPVR